MEVDIVQKGKDKGKGKEKTKYPSDYGSYKAKGVSKDKGKGKGKAERAEAKGKTNTDVECWYSKKKGHRAQDCWWNDNTNNQPCQNAEAATTTTVQPGPPTSSISTTRGTSPSQGGATANSATTAAEVMNVEIVPEKKAEWIPGIEHVLQEEQVLDGVKDRKTDDNHEFVKIHMNSGSIIHVSPKWFVKSEDIDESKHVQMQMADGQKLTHYGSKEVRMELEDGTLATLMFEIADVTLPIISAAKAIAHCNAVIFDRGPDGPVECLRSPRGKTIPLQ